jgi:hypothetical protein
VDNIRIKLIASLCIWVFSIQIVVANGWGSEVIIVEEDSSPEFKKASVPGLVYIDQIQIYKINSGPQHKVPLLPFTYLDSTSYISKTEILNCSSYEYSLTDRKYGLKILVFPFHFFW